MTNLLDKYGEKNKDKLIEIMKKEKSYFKFLRLLKRGYVGKATDIIEDIIARHGQNLDGDKDSKFTTSV
jgi:hypothetical protein